MAARISGIFFYKEFRKVIFFIQSPNLTKQKILAGEGEGVGVAKVSDFLFQKNPSLIFFLILRGWR